MRSGATSARFASSREVPVVAQRTARYWQSWIAGVAVLALVVRMAWNQGGYFPDSYLSAGAIAFGVLGALLLVRIPRFVISTGGLVSLASLAAFTAWTALSTDWSTAHQAGVEAMQRDLTYVGLFGLALMAAGSGRYARQVVWGVLAVIVIVVGGALLSRLYPNLVPSPRVAAQDLGGYRLNYPLGYWNALGALGAMGAVLALGLAADLRTGVGLRALTAGVAVALAIATYLTLSRGAAIALVVGIVVLALMTVRHGSLALTLAIVAGGSALAIVRLQSFPALVDSPTLPPGQPAAGRSFGGELIGIVASAMVLNGLVAAARRSDAVMAVVGRGRQAARIAMLAIALTLLVTGFAQAGNVDHFVSRQFNAFWSTAGETSPAAGRARFNSLNGTRGDVFRVAWNGFKAHPVLGDGVGSFRNRWLRERPIYENVRNAHSLELETLSEEGLIGFALLALFIGTVITAAIRARLSPLGLGRAQGAAVSAACAVWLIHSAFDWDWQMTGLTGITFVLAATLLPARGDERRSAAAGPDGA